jgi:hypothetical protein
MLISLDFPQALTTPQPSMVSTSTAPRVRQNTTGTATTKTLIRPTSHISARYQTSCGVTGSATIRTSRTFATSSCSAFPTNSPTKSSRRVCSARKRSCRNGLGRASRRTRTRDMHCSVCSHDLLSSKSDSRLIRQKAHPTVRRLHTSYCSTKPS